MQAPEFNVLFQQTQPDELMHQHAPLLGGMLFPDAEGAQAIVFPRQHLLRSRAAQDRDDVRRPEALAGQLHAGKKLLRGGGGVGHLALCGWRAVVTVAAGLPERLAEVGQQRPAAAITRLSEAHQCLEPRFPPRSFTLAALIDEMAVDHGVAAAVKQQAIRPQAVPASAANFLVIALQVFGEVSVNDETDIGLVDAHAESNRRNHQRRFTVEEALLVPATHSVFQAGVVGQGGPAVRVEGGAQFIGLLARAAVDNAGLSATLFEKGEHLGQSVVARLDGEKQVWAVEAGHKLSFGCNAQQAPDVLTHARCGRGGKGEADGLRETAAHLLKLAIFGTEIVAPFRDAVCFINGQASQPGLFEQHERLRPQQGFRRDVEELDEPATDTIGDGRVLVEWAPCD